jgi:formylglycine-generating enzyme required for sulfatase activity
VSERPQSTGDELITPATFRPADPKDWRRGPRIRPGTAAVLVALLVLVGAAVFTFTAKPVLLEFAPDADTVAISGGPTITVGERTLMRPGTYTVTAQREGYYLLRQQIEVARTGTPAFRFEFVPLPGRVTLQSSPVDGARVVVDGAEIGETPLEDVEIHAGPRRIEVLGARYLPWAQEVEIEGRGIAQSISVELEPGWADVTLASEPAGAEISLSDGTVLGTTPATVPVMAGTELLMIKKEGHKAWQAELELEAGTAVELPLIELAPADGLLLVRSAPAGATVSIDGTFHGRTPIEIELAPEQTYRVDLFRPGHQQVRREVTLASGTERRLDVELPLEVGRIEVDVEPATATLLVNGREAGNARQVLTLPSISHDIEVRKDGYVSYRTSVTPRPGFPQEINLRLLTVEEARRASIQPEIETAAGQTMRLLHPGDFTMGSSRREPGRRANEVYRAVTLTRPFYVGTTEVTNAQFRLFAREHDSGQWEGRSLNDDDQPVANVSWIEAALYCNWLSAQDGLPPAYIVQNGRIVGFDPESTGYRLPTEAEWEWAARVKEDGTHLRFPWGEDMPPPNRSGNFADRSVANLLGRTVTGYVDGHIVSAPVGSFRPNHHGLYDMGGNVAEWVNDFYGATSEELPADVTDPIGPDRGEYHVIRGSSWMHGTVTDLRLTFRDFGRDARRDVGFRIARYLE